MHLKEPSPDETVGWPQGEAALCSGGDDLAQARANAELYEQVAAALAHDLNNALQGVLGPLWELEELTAAMPAAKPHLFRMQEACTRGMALVRLQYASFAASGQGHAAVATVIEEARPLLRHLLGMTQILRVTTAPAAQALTTNPQIFRRLLLQLCLSFGQRIRTPARIELTLSPTPALDPRPPISSQEERGGERSSVSLRIAAHARGQVVVQPEGPPAAAIRPAFSASDQRLAERLGVTLRAHSEDSLLTFEVQFPSPLEPARAPAPSA